MPKEKWPLYDLYGLSTIPEIVEACIASLKGKTVIEQLRVQRVRGIFKSNGDGVNIGAALGYFTLYPEHVMIDLHSCPLSVWCVAHELGHTFELLSEEIFFPDWKNRFLSSEHYTTYAVEIEAFAEAFADRWICENNNHQALDSLLRDNLEKSWISCEL